MDSSATSEHFSNVRKVLSLCWDCSNDSFVFDFEEILSCAENLPFIKRSILKVSAMFFDPFGLMCPIVLQTKLLNKRLCFEKLDWDEPVSPDVLVDWRTFWMVCPLGLVFMSTGMFFVVLELLSHWKHMDFVIALD